MRLPIVLVFALISAGTGLSLSFLAWQGGREGGREGGRREGDFVFVGTVGLEATGVFLVARLRMVSTLSGNA